MVRPLAFHLQGSEFDPNKVHLNVDSKAVLMLKEYSQRSAESCGFSPGTPVFSHRESWQGGLGHMGPYSNPLT